MRYLKIFLSIPILFSIFLSPVAAKNATTQEITPPQRDQVAAEKNFNQAYRSIMGKHYWSGIALIDQALKLDPYYVDGYLLKSLALYRIGHLEKATQNLTYYLEVRTRDYIARKIYQGMKKISKDGLSVLPVRYSGDKRIIKDYFELTPTSYTGTTGLGNGTWIGEKLCIPDTLGDHVVVLSKKNVSIINIKKPVSITPIDDATFVVATSDGSVMEYNCDEFNNIKKTRESDIDETIGEIRFITSDKCVLTHPLTGTITVRNYPNLKILKKWSPDKDSFPELKGISVLGNIMAISNRNRDKVIITDVEFEKEPISIETDSPRSVLLISKKDILVLSDKGTLTLFRLEKKKWTIQEVVATPEGFSLCAGNGKISVITADGRNIYSLTPNPSQKETIMTGMSLYNPQIYNLEGNKVLHLNARVSNKFRDYIANQKPVFSSVWQNKMRPGQINLTSSTKGDVFIISSEKNKYLTDREKFVVVLKKQERLENVIKNIWEENSDISSIILDSSIKAKKDEIVWLLRFCKFNGIVLNCWSTTIPSEFLLNATLNSGGKCYFALNISSKNIKKQESNILKIKIFYQKTAYSSGYPSKNMLSTIADFGIISYRDWLPMWPDLLKAKK